MAMGAELLCTLDLLSGNKTYPPQKFPASRPPWQRAAELLCTLDLLSGNKTYLTQKPPAAWQPCQRQQSCYARLTYCRALKLTQRKNFPRHALHGNGGNAVGRIPQSPDRPSLPSAVLPFPSALRKNSLYSQPVCVTRLPLAAQTGRLHIRLQPKFNTTAPKKQG